DSIPDNSRSRSIRSWTSWRRDKGSASGKDWLITANRFLMESGVRLRPRFGLCASSASRYRRTARPWSRPSANAALCDADMGERFRRDFVVFVALDALVDGDDFAGMAKAYCCN